eukprot:8555519-Ditylum_brightwellii.AAC.1
MSLPKEEVEKVMGSFRFFNTYSSGPKACNGSTLSDMFLEKLSALSLQHGFVIAVDEVLTRADNATKPAFEGRKSVYEAFKNSSHSNGVDMSEYKYMFCKALDTKLMVDEMIGYKRKRR